jgi:hypothetical protein
MKNTINNKSKPIVFNQRKNTYFFKGTFKINYKARQTKESETKQAGAELCQAQFKLNQL